MTLTDAHRQHLRTSGLTDETIALARLATVTDRDELARIARWSAWPAKLGGAIAFPVFAPGRTGEDEALFARLRPDHPTGQKYLGPKDVPVHPYYGPRTLAEGRLADVSAPLFLTEGEKKTLLLDQLGCAVIGATGVDCFHDTEWRKASGEWTLHASIRESVLLSGGRQVVIVYDSDSATNQNVIDAARRLAWGFRQLGAGDVVFVQIPTESASDKLGIDDFFVKYGEARTREILAQGRPLTPLRPKRSNRKVEGTSDRLPAPGTQLTDLGNAERLVGRHGRDLRYCAQLGGWYVWDSTRWQTDQTGRTYRRAFDTARQMIREAADLPGDAKDELLRHASKSESRPRLEAMIALAQEQQAVRVLPAAFDANPYLLNVQNGTVDLRTGELKPHDRADLITKIAAVEHQSGMKNLDEVEAAAELWQRFLDESTEGDQERIEFLQRAAGYTLAGDTSEDKFFFIYGPTRSGKSTFLAALSAALGDYAAWSDFSTFLDDSRGGGGGGAARPELVRLVGRRMVACSEVDEGKKFAEGLLKTITGGDEVSIRDLYGKTFTFRPTFKLWFAANDAPRARADDDAIWRRLVRVPFDRTAPNPDKDLRRKLTEEPACRAAILAWAIEGCLMWQRDGLKIPESVKRSTEEYREEMDPIADFTDFFCVFERDAHVSRRALRRAYDNWARGAGAKPLGAKRFVDAIRKRALEALGPNARPADTETRVREGNAPERGWAGVRLTTAAERAALEVWNARKDGDDGHGDYANGPAFDEPKRLHDYNETEAEWLL